jgi:glycosyltransferase involved in cell wall biosynthesis
MPDNLRAAGAPDAVAISIVVPVYNGADTIGDCIESLLGIDDPDAAFEIIVVDNGSTDRTFGILDGYRDRIRMLHEPIRGAAAARNTGVRNARGDIIAFTDADCVVEPRWLRNLIPALCDPAVGIAGGPILATSPSNRVEKFGERIHDHRRALEDESAYAITMNWASRRAVLEEAGLFDPTLIRGQDADLARRIRMRGYRLVFCPDAIVRHRNERTLRGLFREGVAHGRAIALVQAKYPAASRADTFNPLAARRRLMRSLRRCLTGMNRLESLCEVVFDAGKLTGVRLHPQRTTGPASSKASSPAAPNPPNWSKR